MTSPSVIHLDTGFLIRALVPGSPEAADLRTWLLEGRALRMSCVAWAEFLCGPGAGDAVPQDLVAGVVRRRMPLTETVAAAAARLFNAGGRRRGTLPDAMIAATALEDQAALATTDRSDFTRWADEGLEVVGGG